MGPVHRADVIAARHISALADLDAAASALTATAIDQASVAASVRATNLIEPPQRRFPEPAIAHTGHSSFRNGLAKPEARINRRRTQGAN